MKYIIRNSLVLDLFTTYDERLAVWAFPLKPNNEGSDYEVNSDVKSYVEVTSVETVAKP